MDKHAAPPFSYSLAISIWLKSSLIMPLDGLAFFTSAIIPAFPASFFFFISSKSLYVLYTFFLVERKQMFSCGKTPAQNWVAKAKGLPLSNRVESSKPVRTPFLKSSLDGWAAQGREKGFYGDVDAACGELQQIKKTWSSRMGSRSPQKRYSSFFSIL